MFHFAHVKWFTDVHAIKEEFTQCSVTYIHVDSIGCSAVISGITQLFPSIMRISRLRSARSASGEAAAEVIYSSFNMEQRHHCSGDSLKERCLLLNLLLLKVA